MTRSMYLRGARARTKKVNRDRKSPFRHRLVARWPSRVGPLRSRRVAIQGAFALLRRTYRPRLLLSSTRNLAAVCVGAC